MDGDPEGRSRARKSELASASCSTLSVNSLLTWPDPRVVVGGLADLGLVSHRLVP